MSDRTSRRSPAEPRRRHWLSPHVATGLVLAALAVMLIVGVVIGLLVSRSRK
ncbi:hypothetical protein [Saccharopolyspora sp. NPDC049426]|uniref:hypothetical protein n=1 Tax=Saccharopolyspora sp. NPDC049426 TaxID=3155652 RepID=UPI00342F4F97